MWGGAGASAVEPAMGGRKSTREGGGGSVRFPFLVRLTIVSGSRGRCWLQFGAGFVPYAMLISGGGDVLHIAAADIALDFLHGSI